MAVDTTLLQRYRKATEALLDAITVFEARVRTHDGAEYKRLEGRIEECQAEMDRVRLEFENPEELRRIG